MTNPHVRRLDLAGLLLSSTFLPGAAWAQATTPPPPVYSTIDRNGVDLASGRFVAALPHISVGQARGGGLSHTFLDMIRGRDNLRATITISGPPVNIGPFGAGATVSVGGKSIIFISFNTGADWVPYSQTGGQTLVASGGPNGTYTFTDSDGTVVIFSRTLPYGSNGFSATQLTRPNGDRLTYTYTANHSPSAVTSNQGFMIKYEYVGGGGNLSKVIAINTAVEYCDPAQPHVP